MSILLPERLIFYDDSPPLSQGDLQQRFTDWFSGEEVFSSLVAVGRIIPSSAELAVVAESEANTDEYGDLRTSSKARTLLKSLEAELMQIVNYDARRVGAAALHFCSSEVGPGPDLSWHSDGSRFVRWVTSIGAGGTEGAKGKVRLSDAKNRHTLTAMVAAGELEPELWPTGTVLRLMPGDIHRSPELNGRKRIFVSNTVSSYTEV